MEVSFQLKKREKDMRANYTSDIMTHGTEPIPSEKLAM
jgi:hypothetical protein